MKFREMRRKKQQLSQVQCTAILEKNTSGVLAVLGDGGYPYAVPVSYVYEEGKLYFHCAKKGHKLDAIKACNQVSFCVVDQDLVAPQEYTSYYRSVIVFGNAVIMEKEEEIRRALKKMALKYAPDDSEEGRSRAIEKDRAEVCIVEITIEHMTGKESIELARKRISGTAISACADSQKRI